MQNFVVVAETRTVQGTGASRRLRREGKLPGIVYGGTTGPQMIALDHNELWKQLKHEAFYSHILTLQVGDESQQVVLKDLHRHPVREEVLHADFQRVQADVAIRVRVPLHFLNETICPGVKTGGGIVDRMITEVEVECLPANLPEYIEIDMIAMQAGESVHLSNLTLPEGVAIVELKHGNDATVVSVQRPAGGSDDEAAAE